MDEIFFLYPYVFTAHYNAAPSKIFNSIISPPSVEIEKIIIKDKTKSLLKFE